MTQNKPTLDFAFVLASSVHDMKNSVGMLLQTLESLTELPDSSPVAEQMGVLGYEAARINSELIQLLSLYRMQENSLLLQVDECYVDDVLAEQVARNELMFKSRKIELVYHCDKDLLWYMDAELIGGVVNNLLVNAARYCRQHVKLSASIQDGSLCIAVADDGRGFPDSMLEAPLQPCAGVSFASGSTNLGLLFATQVAQLHVNQSRCGRIELNNGAPLGGGRVIVCLP